MSPNSRATPSVIEQEVVFIGATPHDVFEMLMDAELHASFTAGEAAISRQVGGVFSTFDGWANGKMIELVTDQKIVQTWRNEDWPAKVNSTCTFTLSKSSSGTKLRFRQVGVPHAFVKNIAKGWEEYYWQPMQEVFDQRLKATK